MSSKRVRTARVQRAFDPDADFLEETTRVRVRFQEVDSLRVTWHGHYLSYFEDGRNAFGRRFGFGYQDILDAGYVAPLVHVELDYHAPSTFDEPLDVRTRMHLVPGARLVFAYLVTGATGDVKVTGHTVQVYTDLAGELVITRPPFVEAFLERWGHEVQSV